MSTAVSADLQRAREILKHENRYHAVRILGSGAFGMVVLAVDKTNNSHVAIKFVRSVLTQKKYPEREILNHRMLRHPHVIEFRKLFAVPNYLGIVMEYANGCSLFDLVKKFKRLNANMTRWIFQQVIIAVDYCHRKGVSSRDIKCENILLDSGSQFPIAKLCDFGYSHQENTQSDAQSMVGSSDYMAPEVINNQNLQKYDAVKADIWSCGVVLYIMLVGQYPFSPVDMDRRSPEFIEALRRRVCTLSYKCPSFVPREARHLIKKCLCLAKDRISIQGILRDPWFLLDFPSEASAMNDHIMRLDEETMTKVERRQSKAEVLAILDRARSETAKAKTYTQPLSDSWIQQTVSQELQQ